MKLKGEYIVLGVIIVGIALFLILRTGNRVQYELPEIAVVERDAVARILIEGAERTVELRRTGEEWTIGPQEYPADTSQANQMLSAITGFGLTAMVSEAGSYSRYDLDESSRLRIAALDAEGEELIVFDVGKQGSSRKSSFVVIPDDHRVFASTADLRTVFDKEAAKLRDLVVMSFDRAVVSEISARRGSETLVLTRTKTEKDGETVVEWKNGEGIVWTTESVDRVLRTLSNLRCSEFLQEDSAVGGEILSVTLKGDKGYTVSFHDERDSKYAALSSESGYPFLLSSYQFSDVEKIFEAPAQSD